MAGLPNDDGKLILKLKAEDIERGEDAVDKMQRDMNAHAAALPRTIRQSASCLTRAKTKLGN